MPGSSLARLVSARLLAALAALLVSIATFGASTAFAVDAMPAEGYKIDFTKSGASTPVPLGYLPDTGAAYSTGVTPARGWVKFSSLSGATHYGLDLSDRGRDRGAAGGSDPRFRTFMLDKTGNSTGTVTQGAWEFEVKSPASYYVQVGMGDNQATDSVYQAQVENTTLIDNVAPNAATGQYFVTSPEKAVDVNDGRITLSCPTPGSNCKFSWITIRPVPPDTQAPPAPTALSATAGVGNVALNWTAPVNPDNDTLGYNVYRSTSPNFTPAAANKLNATLVSGTSYPDSASLTAGTTYYYQVTAVDKVGNISPGSNEANAIPQAATGAQPLKVDFKPATSGTLAPGYVADVGYAYAESTDRKFGWITEATARNADITTHVPLDITSPTRLRYRAPAKGSTATTQKQDTLAQISISGQPNAAWEAKVPNGYYSVNVGLGDPAASDSRYVINAEGTKLADYTPPAGTTDIPSRSTVAVSDPAAPIQVTDGRLTIDGIGGTNVKVQYIDITPTSPPPPCTDPTNPACGPVKPKAPQNVNSTSDNGGIYLTWAPNSEDDLWGYNVYRGTTPTVDTTSSDAKPLNGSNPLTITAYTDTTGTPGVPYYYVVTAVNRGGTSSDGSNQTTVTQPIVQVDRKFNFQPANTPTVGGYTADTGAAYGSKGSAGSWGWVRQDSLSSAQHVAQAAGPARDRNTVADQRTDTFVHMQYDAGNGTPVTPVAWEFAVPNGTYDVEVSVGDPLVSPSVHEINIEGQPTITDFFPTQNQRWKSSTATVAVSDGRLTIDAIGGTNTKINYVTIKSSDPGTRPSVGDVSPYDGAIQVSRNRSITAEVNLPNLGAGIDAATLNDDSVYLRKAGSSTNIPAKYNTSAAGDVIVLVPRANLDGNTQYTFTVNGRLKDTSGASFAPKTTSFTTGAALNPLPDIARFIKVPQAQGQGELLASLAIGPDNRLYVTTLDGKILRFPIDDTTGNLGAPTTITTVIDHENGPRHILGLAFDPASTASAPILWVTTGSPEFANAPDWTGKITRLSGPDLSVADDYVTGLPRSVRDHETNSLAFKDGMLYLTQGSNSATGATDVQWGLRPEHLLNAAVLKLDPAKAVAKGLPVNVKTEGEDVNYDPFAADAPLTIYATGIRNAYDLVWHSNGQLYVPTNGSAANGNAPDVPTTLPPVCSKRADAATPYTPAAMTGPTKLLVQPDLLFRVQQGGYYGHPNPSRCEYIFFGGNPTSNADPLETFKYPVGTQPDPNWRQPSFNFGNHYSPNGSIEYRSSKFGGKLDHALLVTRYSDGDDIVALPITDGNPDPTASVDGIPGLGGLDNPLDITEDNRNGNLYVTELSQDKAPEITLIKPDETNGAPIASASPSKVVKSAVVNGTSTGQTITLRNSGNAPLRLNGITIGGADASQFKLDVLPSIPQSINPDQEVTADVQFTPTSLGVKDAAITITTDDPVNPTTTIPLRGLGTAAPDANGNVVEPSLQRILDTYQIPVNVGNPNPDSQFMPDGASLGQEIPIQSFRKAGSGKVTITPLAAFGAQGDGSTMASFGWNETGNGSTDDASPIGSVLNSSAQSLDPKTNGVLSFDPDVPSFGFWATWNGFKDSSGNTLPRTSWTQDALNTFGTSGGSHQARGYQLRDASGTVVPGAYVIAFEDVYGAGITDFNDLVYIVRNVQAEGSGDGRVTLASQDGSPFDDRMEFNRIGTLANPPANTPVHDKSTVRVTNSGTTPFDITSLPITGNFQLTSVTTYPTAQIKNGVTTTSPTFPITIPGGYAADISVRFIAEAGRVNTGQMKINTTSALTPTVNVDLAGYWQDIPEGSNEIKLSEMVRDLFGFGTTVLKPGQTIGQKGKVSAVGDEVLSPYWRQADPSKTSRVTQLAAFHTQADTSAFYWYMKGSGTKGAIPGQKQVMYHGSNEGQSLFPKKGQGTNPPSGITTQTFSPTAAFGFMIGGQEKTDDTLNNITGDTANGCTGACGHHVRIFPAKDRTGKIMPNTYLVANDYAATAGNYDYNDNLYLVTNITPDVNDKPLLYRVDAGSTSAYTDKAGNLWKPDTADGVTITPPDAKLEGTATAAIGLTDDDPLYATYRGNVGNVPIAQRSIKFRFPTRTATKVDVRLYMTDQVSTAAGVRQFDIYANGEKKTSTPIDLFALVGKSNAYSRAINGIPVSGSLELNFQAVKDYAAISGIEVFCAENCGSD